MKRQQAAALLESLAREHLFNNANSLVNTNNSIQAFGTYTITKSEHGYKIYKNRVKVKELGLKKSALSWCIADKYRIKVLSENIQRYDQELDRRYSEIAHYKSVLQSSEAKDKKIIMLDRISDSLTKAEHAKNQLDKCINRAKYWQQKGFNNETARLGIKPSDRKIAEGI